MPRAVSTLTARDSSSSPMQGSFNISLTDPRHKLAKTYWVQVEGIPDPAGPQEAAGGVVLRDGLTLPAKVKRIGPPPVWEQDLPIRVRRHIPTSWLELTITEGRNRQVPQDDGGSGPPDAPADPALRRAVASRRPAAGRMDRGALSGAESLVLRGNISRLSRAKPLRAQR
ncbi:MAG: hypothetical protein MZV70_65810 [Desulfobacterales bacterium]|nr:hypothetical protein [Desulfobacterales bacterium]